MYLYLGDDLGFHFFMLFLFLDEKLGDFGILEAKRQAGFSQFAVSAIFHISQTLQFFP